MSNDVQNWLQEKRLRDKLKVQLENSREKIKADFERKLTEAKSKLRREIEDLETKQTKLSESSIEEIRFTSALFNVFTLLCKNW